MNVATQNKRLLIAALRKCREGRNLFCVISAVLIVLQSILPTAARASDNAIWLEICSEFGVQTIQLDMSGNDPVDPKPCLDCDDCAFCMVAGADAVPVWMNTEKDISRTAEAFVLARGVHTANPAQFWPDCRGPPWTDMDISKTAIRSSVGSILSSGDTPWT